MGQGRMMQTLYVPRFLNVGPDGFKPIVGKGRGVKVLDPRIHRDGGIQMAPDLTSKLWGQGLPLERLLYTACSLAHVALKSRG